MQFLGDTRPKIAGEKAGIIKSQTPVVIGEIHTETRPVFEEIANNLSAPMFFAEQANNQLYNSDLKGLYQIKNQKTVLQSLKVLIGRGWKISTENIKLGLANVVKNTGLKGRWQKIGDSPLCIADTAHNLEGLTYVATQLDTIRFDTLHLVMGFVNDKDVLAMINLLPQKNAIFYLSAPDIPRAMPVEKMKDNLNGIDIKALYFSSLQEAFSQAKSQAQSKDLIFVGGSIFTVAELLPDD
jgi:dihydrofolate synthase/folylpolyglutamate synthase